MSEPRQIATEIDAVTPDVWRWGVHDDRIDARSDAYAVVHRDGAVLVDPLALDEIALERLRPVGAICLTIQSHQRAAWRYRRLLGVPVYAPHGSEGLEETPDIWFRDGDVLPGGLRAVHAPGPCEASYAFHLAGPAEGGTLFIGDLLVEGRGGELAFVPDLYQDEPLRTRESVRALLALQADVVLSGHAAPVTSGGRAAMRRALQRDRRR